MKRLVKSIRLNMRIWRNGRRTRHNAPFSQFAIRKYRPFGDYSLSPFRHASHGDPVKPHCAQVLMGTPDESSAYQSKGAKIINLSL